MRATGSIKNKIIIPTTILFVALMTLLAGTLTWESQETQRAMLESKAVSTTNFVEKISASYIVNFDLTALESFVAELTKDPDVAFAEFHDPKKKPLTKATRNAQDDKSLLIYQREIKDSSKNTVGYLTVGYKQVVVENALRKSLLTSAVLWIAGLAACVFGLTSLVVRVTRPIKDLESVIGAVALGKLNQKIDIQSDDEIGNIARAVNGMVSGLRELITQIRKASDAMSVSASQLDNTSLEINRSSESQNAAASEAARLVEDMTHSIDQVTISAKAAVEISVQANDTAKTSQRIVADAAKEMGRIAEAVSGSSKNVTALGQRSNEISNIVEVIKAVADQTNLLALNAAIEAARAGEQGRGFAVVADEVRSLAQRTTAATAEISQTIDAIQNETQNAVAAMDSGTERVRTGVELANSGAAALNEILRGVEKSLQSVNEIATASVQQSSATHAIAGRIENIARVSGKNAHDTQQLLESAQQLQALSQSLQASVGRFEV